ncbi:MAG: nucleoside-triphosphatase [Clostridia bacterium]|nr:nucleoside-triphosphatase [Clostridia bacterium]
MHVFLTGDRQIGKSRAVRRAADALERPCYGFRTQFLTKERGTSSLYMVSPQGEPTLDEAHMVAELRDGKMRPLTERFDSLGGALLREARQHPEGLILMDECGHLEKNAQEFQKEILLCLDGDTPVLGVLRKDQPWHDFIKQHPQVRVITVTEENRSEIDGVILELLLQKKEEA